MKKLFDTLSTDNVNLLDTISVEDAAIYSIENRELIKEIEDDFKTMSTLKSRLVSVEERFDLDSELSSEELNLVKLDLLDINKTFGLGITVLSNEDSELSVEGISDFFKSVGDKLTAAMNVVSKKISNLLNSIKYTLKDADEKAKMLLETISKENLSGVCTITEKERTDLLNRFMAIAYISGKVSPDTIMANLKMNIENGYTKVMVDKSKKVHELLLKQMKNEKSLKLKDGDELVNTVKDIVSVTDLKVDKKFLDVLFKHPENVITGTPFSTAGTVLATLELIKDPKFTPKTYSEAVRNVYGATDAFDVETSNNWKPKRDMVENKIDIKNIAKILNDITKYDFLRSAIALEKEHDRLCGVYGKFYDAFKDIGPSEQNGKPAYSLIYETTWDQPSYVVFTTIKHMETVISDILIYCKKYIDANKNNK
jgi:hypothetical protein